jgi:alpha-galactosidase
MEKERATAGEHGYYRGIGDRVSDYYGGIGAYHQLRFFSDVARDMEELCPDAWLINTSNPVFEATNLLTRTAGDLKTVGMCHGVFAFKKIIGKLGLDPAKVTFQAIGLNHCIWLTHFTYDGRDGYPLLDAWIEKDAPRYWASDEYIKEPTPWGNEDLCPGAIDSYRIHGLFPIGDSVRSPSPWWHHTDLATKQKWYGSLGGFDSELGWPYYLNHMESRRVRVLSLVNAPPEELFKEFPLTPSGEPMIPFMEAMATGRPAMIELNIPNCGAIDGIADDVVVEIPAQAGPAGIQGLRCGPLPARLMNHVINPRIRQMECVLGAFLNHDRRSLMLLIAEDPRTRSFEQAERLVNTLLTQPWNEEADKHYR